MATPNNPNMNNSNINYNTILVERHYIPVDIYTRIYFSHPQNNSNFYSYEQYPRYITRQPATTTSRRSPERNSAIPQAMGQTNTNNAATSRYNDLLSFFNIQSRNATHTTNTEPLQSRVITRSYETAGDMDQSFVNLLMTAFYAPGETTNSTNVAAMASGLTQAQIDTHSRIITHSSNIDLDTTSCSICAQEWQHGEEVRKLTGCRHYFHKTCVDTWLHAHNTCPLCRTNIIQTSGTNGTGINDVD